MSSFVISFFQQFEIIDQKFVIFSMGPLNDRSYVVSIGQLSRPLLFLNGTYTAQSPC